jgi:EAL domain-containing protein (putative c-di-GMP-specific phosphodiesterase class I)
MVCFAVNFRITVVPPYSVTGGGTAIALSGYVADVKQEALERVLDEEYVVLLYQPIHELRSGAIYGAEALLRQRRESGEIREAHVISEAAEESDGTELFELDEMVLRQSFTDAANWQRHFPDVRLHVNLSPREFEEGNLFAHLRDLLGTCGTDARHVSLEITETSYIEYPKETMKVLEEIKALGIALWLDDFGTGHSSITHLRHFPLDGIKIPRAFVKDVTTDHRCAAIVHSLLDLAHDLELDVIAEGIETEEQAGFLRDRDCDYVQGFLFSRPMAADAFQATLAGRSSGQ